MSHGDPPEHVLTSEESTGGRTMELTSRIWRNTRFSGSTKNYNGPFILLSTVYFSNLLADVDSFAL